MTQTADSVYCESLWQAGCADFNATLGPKDAALCQKCPNYETARLNLKSLEQDQERRVTLLLRRMAPAVDNLRNFTMVLRHAEPTADIPMDTLWGALDLLIHVTVKSAYAFSRVVDMIDEISAALDLFRIYEATVQQEPKQAITALYSMVEFVTFIVAAVRFFRFHAMKTGQVLHKSWPQLDDHYHTTVTKIRSKVSQMKEISLALQGQRQFTSSAFNQAALLQSLDQLDTEPDRASSTSLAETAVNTRPLVNNIPYSRNRNFFGRKDELEVLRKELDYDEDHPEFRSYAVWGMGGIGKTQLALSYAHERAEKGTPVVIWINSETQIDIYQSYTDVADRLELPDRRPDASGNQNQFAVTKWLQKTSSEWLLVFDNVEDVNLIRQCWAVSPRGSVLVTSRSEVVSMDPAAGGLEVPVFTTGEAEDFLYSLLKRKDYSNSERHSCTQLAGRLDGLPLALMLMGMQIRIKHIKIERFLKDYETNYERYHRTPSSGVPNIYYPHSLETAYLTSFKAASEQAQAILGVICLIAPDRIPEELFQPADLSLLTADLAFCGIDSDFDDALEQLLGSSLIGRDPDNGTMRIHRIIQERYRTWLGKEKRRQWLLTAAKLLCSAFPKSVNGLAMRNEWHICQKYIPHAMALCSRYTEDKVKPRTPSEFDDFTALLTSCGWYLMECGSWSQFRILIDVAFEVCEDKHSIAYAHLLMSAASVACESGNASKAYPLIDKAMEIRKALLPPNHEELANLYHNYANIHLTYEVTPKTISAAKETIYKALEIDMTKPEAERNRILHIRYLVLSLAYTLGGDYTKAWAYIDEAQRYAVQTFGEKCHFWASGETKRGAVRYLQARYELAKHHYLAAHAVYSKANDIHPSTSSTEVRLGSIALIQGHVDDAHDWFQKALLKCQLNESDKGDRGDTARVMRKLSQVFEAKGMTAKAQELATAAREIRKEVQGERFESLPESDYAYDLMIFVPFR